MEAYVTLEEAAELEEVKYKTLSKNISRNAEGFVIKNEKGINGGKDRVFVAVSSLSKSARNAYEAPEGEAETVQDIREEAPWYVGTDIEWYMANYKENYFKGIELRNIVRKFLEYDDRGRTQYAEEFS